MFNNQQRRDINNAPDGFFSGHWSIVESFGSDNTTHVLVEPEPSIAGWVRRGEHKFLCGARFDTRNMGFRPGDGDMYRRLREITCEKCLSIISPFVESLTRSE